MSRTPAEKLFRRQALGALHQRPLGRAICFIPPVWKWITTLLVTAFAAATAIAPHIEWHRTEAVQGWLVPAAGVLRVTSPGSGVVTARFAEFGQLVDAGDVLATITTEKYSASGEARSRRNGDLISAAIEESFTREKLLGVRFELQQEKIAARVGLLETELRSIEKQLGHERSRRDIEEQQLHRLDSAGDAIPVWETLRQEEFLAARLSAIEELTQRKVRTSREISGLRAELEAIPVNESLARSELLAERTRLERELDNSSGEVSIIAPVAGRIADIKTSVGDAVPPGHILISIVPAGADLRAELFVPSRSASHLVVGQNVRLFIDAWPRDKFGAISGSIESVADSVGDLSDARGAGAYRAIVRMKQTDRPLRPGMTLTAELLLEQRDLVDWLVGPLLSRFSR